MSNRSNSGLHQDIGLHGHWQSQWHTKGARQGHVVTSGQRGRTSNLFPGFRLSSVCHWLCQCRRHQPARHLVTLVLLGLTTANIANGADADAPAKPAPVTASKETAPKESALKPKSSAALLPWATSLAQGRQSALSSRKPLFVRAGGPGCPWCVKLEREIAKPEVQKALAQWTLVYINVDEHPDEAQALRISGIPALRLLTPAGQAIASQDGFVEAGALVSWLSEHLEKATATADALLVSTEAPSAVEIVRLSRHFSDRDAASREAAMRRLSAFPDLARSHIVEQLRTGNLAVRLTALELLRQWNAPIAELDPWRPATITPARLAALDRWLEKPLPPQPKPGDVPPLSPQDLADARQEIDRLLKADPDSAAAMRQRLARLGKGLLPEVYARLKQTSTDQQHERLVALRYELVASGSLALRWPQGIERLAATDSTQRHKAIGELQELAVADDQPLLLELFSDPDPLVREMALRSLQKVGGSGATSALVQLLKDPEPNVRAAVLKQLSETPQPGLAAKIGEYIAQEKDPDLVVHAIRVLRESKSKVALKSLVGATTHASWRVRAEATEALGKVLGNDRGGGEESADVTAARAAILARLGDDDGFVVSRAIEGLSTETMGAAIDPLLKAANRFPELTLPAVNVLVRGGAPKDKVFGHLHDFMRRKEPAVRSAAAAGLVLMNDDRTAADIAAALRDPDVEVRLNTANAIYMQLDNDRPRTYQLREQEKQGEAAAAPEAPSEPGFFSRLGSLFGESAKPAAATPATAAAKPAATVKDTKGTPQPDGSIAKDDVAAKDAAKPAAEDTSIWDRWLIKNRAGKDRPKWLAAVIPPLSEMLAVPEVKHQVTAGRVLVALGQMQALPVLLDAMDRDAAVYGDAASVLQWLVWSERQTAYQRFAKHLDRSDKAVKTLAMSMAQIEEDRAAPLYWQLLGRPKLTEEDAAILAYVLNAAYVGDEPIGVGETAPNRLKSAVVQAEASVAAGPELRQLVAMIVLSRVAPDKAATAAKRIAADAQVSAGLKRDAFQVLLVTLGQDEAQKLAIESLRKEDAQRQRIAIRMLALGPESLASLRGGHFGLQSRSRSTTYLSTRLYSSGDDNRHKPLAAPPGLKKEDVVPLLKHADPQVAAFAGYLLALFGDSRGVPLLRDQWGGQPDREDPWTRLLYQAIAASNDPQYVPMLRDIYKQLRPWDMSDFYWTIRALKQPEIVELRAQMRREVGMDQLQ
ncbi:MAG: HEAT repeat domain-containing protein [Planctomycetia bacterium]|nr:HEAT repeat domain-containing protein [Planctomycetia bacterium]